MVHLTMWLRHIWNYFNYRQASLVKEKNLIMDIVTRMPNFILIPILIIPHVAIPAALMYVLYLEQQETISRVRRSQHRPRRSRPPPPASNDTAQAKCVKKLNIKTNSCNNAGPSPSPSHSHSHIRAAREKYVELFGVDAIPPSHKQIRKLMSSESLYDCHSPMSVYITDKQGMLNMIRSNMSLKRSLCKPKKTPMRDLVQDPLFQNELIDAANTVCFNRFYKLVLKDWMNSKVLPKIPVQRGLILSQLRPILMSTLWYAEIQKSFAESALWHMNQSPMRSLAQTNKLREHIFDAAFFREVDQEKIDDNPMRKLALEEPVEIARLARTKSLNMTLNRSPMSRFVRSNGNITKQMISWLAGEYSRRLARLIGSPLRHFTVTNRDFILHKACEFQLIQQERKAITTKIVELLSRNYGTLYRKFLLKEFRKEHNIPDVTFGLHCTNTARIVFPWNMQLVNKFLADSNLDGFTSKTLYQGKNQFQSYAYSLLGSGTSINDLTDAAQTFKNISHLTDKDTQVLMLADSTGIEIPDNMSALCKRHIEIHFVKRDRSTFKQAQFDIVLSKVRDFKKRQCSKDLTITVNCLEKWLSDEIVVVVEGNCDGNFETFETLNRELVHHVNLIKGVIFAKLIDLTAWLHLPPLPSKA
jgi:hypothetical protein